MCEDFAPNFSDKGTGCCITTTNCLTLPFSSWIFFTKNNMTVSPTHRPILFPRLKIKLKCRHFDKIEVTEAESQAVLNTLTEHDFKGAFKKLVYARKRSTKKAVVASRPKISF
jgi:hypothetical protein